jgi:hypothetical protein
MPLRPSLPWYHLILDPIPTPTPTWTQARFHYVGVDPPPNSRFDMAAAKKGVRAGCCEGIDRLISRINPSPFSSASS